MAIAWTNIKFPLVRLRAHLPEVNELRGLWAIDFRKDCSL